MAAAISQNLETPVDNLNDKVTKHDELSMELSNMLQVQHAILKYIKSLNQANSIHEASCVIFNDYADKNPTYYSVSNVKIDKTTWIIDTGATTHMCNSLNLFDNHITI